MVATPISSLVVIGEEKHIAFEPGINDILVIALMCSGDEAACLVFHQSDDNTF